MLMQARISLLSARKCSRNKAGFLFCCVIAGYATGGFAQRSSRPAIGNGSVPQAVLLRILKAEDERRWDSDLRDLMTSKSAAVRWRAALAAGRIGSEDSVPALATLLQKDVNVDVRSMAAFAIGETESGAGADVLLAAIKTSEPSEVRARAIEALGKIAAALPKEQETRARELGAAVLGTLKFESEFHSAPDRRLTILLGLTAVLRAK